MDLIITRNSILALLLSEKKITMADIIKRSGRSCDFAFQTMQTLLRENSIRDCKNGVFEVTADEKSILREKYVLNDEDFQFRRDSFMPEMFPVLEFIATHQGVREKEIPKCIIPKKMPLRDFLILNLAFCVNEKYYCCVEIDDLKQRYFAYLENKHDDDDNDDDDDDDFMYIDDFKKHFFDDLDLDYLNDDDNTDK